MAIFDYISGMVSTNNAAAIAAADKANKFSAEQAAIARAYNAQEAAKARDWSKMMSDTAYQRQVADLKAAGINPVLGYMKGSGASTPNAATASTSGVTGIKADTDFSGVSATTQAYNSQIQQEMNEAKIEAEKAMQKIQHAQDWKLTEAEIKKALYVAEKQYQSAVYSADKSSSATLQAAEIHVGGQLAAAEISAAASRYGADSSREAQITSACIALVYQKYAADKNYSAAELRAQTDKELKALGFDYDKQLRQIDFDNLMKQLERFPNNVWQSNEGIAMMLQTMGVFDSDVAKLLAGGVYATADVLRIIVGENPSTVNMTPSELMRSSGDSFGWRP